MKYVIGILKLATGMSIIMFAFISFACELLWQVNPDVTVLLSLFIIITAFLVCCVLIYHVNKTMWNTVDKVHQNNDKGNIMVMIPNIKVIVDFIEYMTK